MGIQIIATRDCRHRPILERELESTDTGYELLFAEDNPEVTERYNIRNSPNLVIDGEIAFRVGHKRSLPSEDELGELLLDHILDGK